MVQLPKLHIGSSLPALQMWVLVNSLKVSASKRGLQMHRENVSVLCSCVLQAGSKVQSNAPMRPFEMCSVRNSNKVDLCSLGQQVHHQNLLDPGVLYDLCCMIQLHMCHKSRRREAPQGL